MLKNYFKTAWRNLFRYKTTTLINLLGLSIGMTATFFIFQWVSNEMGYDQHHANADRIYRLSAFSKKHDTKGEKVPYLFAEAIDQQLPEVELSTRIRPITGILPNVKSDQEWYKESRAAYVDGNWFNMFHYDLVDGQLDNFNQQPHTVILTESKARKYFGQDRAVGKSLRIDSLDYTVQAVVKDNPTNSSFHYDFFMPVVARHRSVHWKNFDRRLTMSSYRTYVKLKNGVNREQFIDKLNNSIAFDEWKKDYRMGILPVIDTHFERDLVSSDLQHGEKKTTYIMLLLGVLLLGIACINYINLTTARASARVKEIGIKKIVGAKRSQLLVQFVVETSLLCFLAFACTLCLIQLCFPFFNNLVNNHFSLSLLAPNLWRIMALTFVSTVVLTSIYPALLLSSFHPNNALRGQRTLPVKDNTLRKTLVVFQFSIALVLIVSTMVISRQMQYIDQKYAHYDKTLVFNFLFPLDRATMSVDERKIRFESAKQQLLAHSSIEEVSMNSGTDVMDQRNTGYNFDWDGKDGDANYNITFFPIGSGLNALYGLEMKEGRWFLPDSHEDERNFVVNETAIRQLNIREPIIGQRMSLEGDTGRIIGVVKDFHYVHVSEKINPAVFGNNPWYANSFSVKSAPGRQVDAKIAAEKIFKQYLPNEPFDYRFVREEFEQIYRENYRTSSMIWGFSILAIFVSCLGLYGLSTFSAEQRYKEIGIRKVLGASVSGIVTMLSKDFVKLVLIAIVISSPIAWWATNTWLEDFEYRIDVEWWIFAVAGLVGILVALFTVGWQAIRVAVTNPVDSLRDE